MRLDKILEAHNIDLNTDIVGIDHESFPYADDYINLLEQLSKISKGKLIFSQLSGTEGYNRDPYYHLAEIKFILNNTEYTLKLSCEDYFDAHILINLNRILKEDLKCTDQFYVLQSEDLYIMVIYLEESLQHDLNSEGILQSIDSILYNDDLKDYKIEIESDR